MYLSAKAFGVSIRDILKRRRISAGVISYTYFNQCTGSCEFGVKAVQSKMISKLRLTYIGDIRVYHPVSTYHNNAGSGRTDLEDVVQQKFQV